MKKLHIDATTFLNSLNQINRGNSANPGWFESSQKFLRNQCLEDGFPGSKNEAWRFTSVKDIANQVLKPATGDLSKAHKKGKDFYLKNAIEIVFVNGVYSNELSSLDRVPSGLSIECLKSKINSEEDIIKPYIENANKSENVFDKLNTAYFEDGVFIDVSPKACELVPIHILHIASQDTMGGYVSNKNIIHLGVSSRLCVVEEFVSISDGDYFINPSTHIAMGENAHLDYYRIESDSPLSKHIGFTDISLEKNAYLNSLSVTIGAKLSRHDLKVKLRGSGSEASLNGLYAPSGDKQHDHYVLVDHLEGHAKSSQLYKGLLRDKSQAVFNGKIFVHKDAQLTDAAQMNNNLLLSSHAKVQTNPQLEIYADDVKCKHGATVGELQKDLLFYLQSRAIPSDRAKFLLCQGFVDDLLRCIYDKDIAEKLHNQLIKDLSF